MLLLIAGIALMRWRLARQLTLEEPPTKVPYDPLDGKRYAGMLKAWRRAVLVWFGIFVVILASYVGACAEAEAAREVVEECSVRLEGQPLQACLAVGHERAMEAAGKSASLSVWVWVVGVL